MTTPTGYNPLGLAPKIVIRDLATKAATGTVTLNTGAAGSVDGITVNGVQIMSGAVAFDTSLTITASKVAANINAFATVPNYVATSAGTVITIKARKLGTSTNGFVVVSSVTTITKTDVNLAGGLGGVIQYTFEHKAIAADPNNPTQNFKLATWSLERGVNTTLGALSFVFDDDAKAFIDTSDVERKSRIKRGWTVEVSLGKNYTGLYRAFNGIISSATPMFPSTGMVKQRIFAIGTISMLAEIYTNIRRYQKKDTTDPDALDSTDTTTRVSEIAIDLLQDIDHYANSGANPVPFTTSQIEMIDIKMPDFQKSHLTIGQAWGEIANIADAYFGIDSNEDAFMWTKGSKTSSLLVTNDIDALITTNWNAAYFSVMLNFPRWHEDTILGNGFRFFHGVGYEREESDQIQQSANATLDLSSKWFAWSFTPDNDNVNTVVPFLSKVGALVQNLTIEIVEDDGTGKPSTNIKARKVINSQRLQKELSAATYLQQSFDKLQLVPKTKYHVVIQQYGDTTNYVGLDYQTGTGTYHDSADGVTWTARVGNVKFREYFSKSTRMIGEVTTAKVFGNKETLVNLQEYTNKNSAIQVLSGLMGSLGKEKRNLPQLVISAPDTEIPLGKKIRIVDVGSGIDMLANVTSYKIEGSAYDKDSNLGAKSVILTIERYSY